VKQDRNEGECKMRITESAYENGVKYVFTAPTAICDGCGIEVRWCMDGEPPEGWFKETMAKNCQCSEER